MPLSDNDIARIADAVADRLAARSVASDAVYTSNKLPPDVPTRDAFHRIVKRVNGAEKRGRVWVVRQAAWDDARSPAAPAEFDARAVAAAVLRGDFARKP